MGAASRRSLSSLAFAAVATILMAMLLLALASSTVHATSSVKGLNKASSKEDAERLGLDSFAAIPEGFDLGEIPQDNNMQDSTTNKRASSSSSSSSSKNKNDAEDVDALGGLGGVPNSDEMQSVESSSSTSSSSTNNKTVNTNSNSDVSESNQKDARKSAGTDTATTRPGASESEPSQDEMSLADVVADGEAEGKAVAEKASSSKKGVDGKQSRLDKLKAALEVLGSLVDDNDEEQKKTPKRIGEPQDEVEKTTKVDVAPKQENAKTTIEMDGFGRAVEGRYFPATNKAETKPATDKQPAVVDTTKKPAAAQDTEVLQSKLDAVNAALASLSQVSADSKKEEPVNELDGFGRPIAGRYPPAPEGATNKAVKENKPVADSNKETMKNSAASFSGFWAALNEEGTSGSSEDLTTDYDAPKAHVNPNNVAVPAQETKEDTVPAPPRAALNLDVQPMVVDGLAGSPKPVADTTESSSPTTPQKGAQPPAVSDHEFHSVAMKNKWTKYFNAALTSLSDQVALAKQNRLNSGKYDKLTKEGQTNSGKQSDSTVASSDSEHHFTPEAIKNKWSKFLNAALGSLSDELEMAKNSLGKVSNSLSNGRKNDASGTPSTPSTSTSSGGDSDRGNHTVAYAVTGSVLGLFAIGAAVGGYFYNKWNNVRKAVEGGQKPPPQANRGIASVFISMKEDAAAPSAAGGADEDDDDEDLAPTKAPKFGAHNNMPRASTDVAVEGKRPSQVPAALA